MPMAGYHKPRGKYIVTGVPMEKLQGLINEVLEITYGKYGAMWRKNLYENDRVRFHILLAEGSLYDRIHQAELEGERLLKKP